MIEQTYRIDMIPDGAPVVVHVSQYDTAARRLSFELYNGGVAYELPAGAVASIAGTKPDNTSFLYAMNVSGNLVSIDLQQQMALVAGDVPAEIQITGAEGKIGSANFIIRVERGPIDENSVISETDLPIFEQLVSDAQTAANTASAAASSVASIVPASPGSARQVLTKTATGADWEDLQWGQITGALTDQTDLASALDAKADKTMLAPVESTSTASQAYAVGDYLVYNGILHKVISAINSGETLTPNTNIEATTAGAELISLNNGLTEIVEEMLPLTDLLDFQTAGFHNSLYRGKSLGNAVTDEQLAEIEAGTFKDLYIGDYWTIGGVNWRIAGFDYWLHTGDTECTAHHLVIVPDTILYSAQMNTSNVTTGAYVGSAMYTSNLAQAKTMIKTAFGDHILNHRELLKNAVSGNYESGGAWYDSTVELMNERMVYGCDIFHGSAMDNGPSVPNWYSIDKSQLPLFRLDHSRIVIRAAWWLRDVVNSARFALVDTTGAAGCTDASAQAGVRPVFGICK